MLPGTIKRHMAYIEKPQRLEMGSIVTNTENEGKRNNEF
jgi:hypothetical protein